MLKIAVATQGRLVSPHFGHCDGFTFYETDGKKIVNESFMPSPPHQPGLLPQLLHEKGARVVIAGGMGGGAIELFNENEITVITGAKGDVKIVLQAYLDGDLSQTTEICQEHTRADSCGH